MINVPMSMMNVALGDRTREDAGTTSVPCRANELTKILHASCAMGALGLRRGVRDSGLGFRVQGAFPLSASSVYPKPFRV